MTAPTPSPSSPLDSNPEVEARMLVAQAWCTKANAHKVMDPELANAVAEIFTPHIKRHRMLSSQIDDLANFIMREIPGEPSQSQGAVDTAIRLLRAYRAPTNQQGADPGQLAAGLDQQIKDDLDTLEGAIYTTSPEMHDCAQPALDRLRAHLSVHPIPAAPAPTVGVPTMCPRCNGQGRTNRPSWVPGDQATWPSTTTVTHLCPPCNGTGILWSAHPGATVQPQARPMTWTMDIPKVPGPYWCRGIYGPTPGEKFVVRIQAHPDGAITMSDCRGRTNVIHERDRNREFAGPIPEPIEPPHQGGDQ